MESSDDPELKASTTLSNITLEHVPILFARSLETDGMCVCLERDDVRLIQSVIASAAKQSTQRQVDCFAALAMTIYV